LQIQQKFKETLFREIIGHEIEELNIIESIIAIRVMLDRCELNVHNRFIVGAVMRTIGKKKSKLRVQEDIVESKWFRKIEQCRNQDFKELSREEIDFP